MDEQVKKLLFKLFDYVITPPITLQTERGYLGFEFFAVINGYSERIGIISNNRFQLYTKDSEELLDKIGTFCGIHEFSDDKISLIASCLCDWLTTKQSEKINGVTIWSKYSGDYVLGLKQN